MNHCFLSRCIMTTSLALFLLGCGAEEKSSTTSLSTIDVFPIVAMDGFSIASPKTSTFIDLSPYIRGGEATISSVRYTGRNVEGCNSPSQRDMGFDVMTTSGALCDYEFRINNAQTSDSGLMKVLSTQAVDPILPPLSHSMTLNGADVEFNLTTLLGRDWPAEYSLSAESVVVQGSEGNIGFATPSGNVITYSGPDFPGWNRIIYTLINPKKPDESIMGTVYITISESINQPPKINDLKYNYNAENNDAVVLTGNSIDINLASFITEPDDQEWQLIEVRSYTASAVTKDSDSITNKRILFSAGIVGEHIVSYVVADHFGGYSFGLVLVTVSAKEQLSTWTPLSVGSDFYTAPLRYSEALGAGFDVTDLWDNRLNNTIAGYSVNVANLYCSTIGTIPKAAEMAALRKKHYTNGNGMGQLNKWPVGKVYLIKNDANTGYLGYDIKTGTVVPHSSGAYYLTCIANSNLNMTMLSRDVVANDSIVTIAIINKAPLTNVTLSKIATGELNDLSAEDVNILITDLNTKLEVKTHSHKSGVYRFKIINTADEFDSVASPIITYNADVNTAKLTSLTVDTYNAKADEKDENKLTATILDANENPVSNQKLTVEFIEKGNDSLTAHLINSTRALITDINGRVNLAITNKEVETVDVLARYGGVNTSEVGPSELTSTITFTHMYAYCHQFIGVADLNCLPYRTLPNGKIFTASPSMQWMNTVLPSISVDHIVEEDGSLGNVGSYPGFIKSNSNKLCAEYTRIQMLDRVDWRLATIDDLKELYQYSGNLYLRGWPTRAYYRAVIQAMDLMRGDTNSYLNSVRLYVSCVSGE